MANVLAELFQNVAKAIREKTGETGKMKPCDFPEKIRSIQAGGTGNAQAELIPLSVTANGTYYPTENVEIGKTYTFKERYTQEELETLYHASPKVAEENNDALLFVVGVDTVVLSMDNGIYLMLVTNGENYFVYTPDMTDPNLGELSEGWHALDIETENLITLEEPPAVTLTENTFQHFMNDIQDLKPLFTLKEYDGFSVADVNVPETVPELEEITITENGTYAPSEKDGFSRVTVNVEAESTGEGPQLYTPSIERSEESITITNPAANGSFVRKYKIYDNEILVSEQNSKSYNLSNLTYGTHLIEVASAGEKFKDSEKSNSINASKYSITMNLTNVNTTFSQAYALHGDSVTITFTLPSVYYTMPDTITATMGGSTDGIVYIKDDRKITIESVTGDIDIAITSKEVKLLDDLSWDTIAAYAADGTLEEQFKIGDTKKLDIYLNKDATSKTTVSFAIAAFHHDELWDGSGKANVTFVAKTGVRLASIGGTVEQWKSYQTLSIHSNFTSSGFICANFPQALRNSLKLVKKKHTKSDLHGLREEQVAAERLFWLSLTEIGLTCDKCLEIEGDAYPIFTDNASRKRKLNDSANYYPYPLRDRKDDQTDGTQFVAVSKDGELSEWTPGTSPYQYIHLFGFCL